MRPHPPSIEALLSSPEGTALASRAGRLRAREALRSAAGRLRRGELAAQPAETVVERLVASAAEALDETGGAGPRRVVNATGVLLHTNLGRAPLAQAAREAMLEAAGYCTLEYDLAEGTRGRRTDRVRDLLLAVLAPGRDTLDAVVTNNNAAALLLALDTVASGRPVAVSRGELVAIGGDFRVPSILAKSGATLLEVGTTNKTTRLDYIEALDQGASAILKVHPSNFRIVGYTEEVSLETLAALGLERGIPLLYDAGSGCPGLPAGTPLGPVPLEALDAGASLVAFSGDKTLGGPQSGILIGRRELVEKAARNPLARALRPDKLVLAALAATLELHLAGRHLEVPFHRMAATPLEELTRRAERLATAARAAGFTASVVESTAVAGGGAGTEVTIPSRAVTLRHERLSADEIHRLLRQGVLPIVGRVAKGDLLLDLRTIDPDEDAELSEALTHVRQTSG